MAAAFGCRPGKILALDALIEQHPSAIRADLIDRGVRLHDLGTPVLGWADFAAIVEWAPHDSALVREQYPDEWRWGMGEQLQAAQLDVLNWLRWAKTKDATYQRNMPQPVPRPGIEPPETIGTATTLAEIDALIGWG